MSRVSIYDDDTLIDVDGDKVAVGGFGKLIMFLSGIAVFAAIALMIFLTVFSFIKVEVAGESEPMNIIRFAFYGDVSCVYAIQTAIDGFKGAFDALKESGMDNLMPLIAQMAQSISISAFYLAVSVYVAVSAAVCAIKAVVDLICFSRSRLTTTCVSMLKTDLVAMLFLSIMAIDDQSIATMSVGTGIVTSVLVGAAVVAIVGFLNFLLKRKDVFYYNPPQKLIRSLVSLVAFAIIYVLLIKFRVLEYYLVMFNFLDFKHVSELFKKVFSSGNIMTALFETNELAILLFATIVFIALCCAAKRAVKGITGSLRYLSTLCDGNEYGKSRKAHLGFVFEIVALALVVVGLNMLTTKCGVAEISASLNATIALAVAAVAEVAWIIFKFLKLGKKQNK